METKKILGLDLGTNSIGWALIEQNTKEKTGRIINAGSRIIPMSQDILGKFDSGVSISQTAERTGYRGIRRLRERHLLRRERLHRVLNILGFLPEHYKKEIDFNKRLGQFLPDKEPKIAYCLNEKTKKNEFVFINSFEEMVHDFTIHQPKLLKIPYDWTIYYLRKKALKHKIEKEELAWLLLHFNQKRGYYQLRGEEEEVNPNKLVEFYSLLVTKVTADEKKTKDDVWYSVHLENGWIYRRQSKTPLDWVGKTKEFIVTTDLNDDGTIKKDKEGNEKRSFRAPADDDWTLIKKKTEQEIDKSQKTVGQYIYDTLLQNPSQKINGKLVRTVERKFYKHELEIILQTQIEFHTELKDLKLFNACLEELYEHNEGHKNSIDGKGFVHLFLNDILFYQRPLKSQKSLISDCKFESRTYLKEGKKEIQPIKCIAKSHPLYQEFRLWQFLQNLRIYKREDDVDVTNEFLKTEEDWVNLFNWLNKRKEIDQKAFFKYEAFNLKKNVALYRWNYVEEKPYPCNETMSQIASKLEKVTNVPVDFLNAEKLEAIWHVLYSVVDKNELEKALKTFAQKNGLGNDFVDVFKKFPPYKSEYGAYSAKAINKLLPLIRIGSYWKVENIHPQTIRRIEHILTGEYDKSIRTRVREKSIHLNTIHDFKGLPVWLTSYIVYDRHSEDGEALKWNTPADIEHYLRFVFKQHSLRNPIVEQVIKETLRVVKDIWQTFGNGAEKYFHEIHIELGREMKNPADKRKQMTEQISANENTNLRIKALLMEMINDKEYENVRPHSPSQQEILKIYEEGVLNSGETIPEDIVKIAKQAQPSSAELTRYKLWLQQKYRSPYTGDVIPLNKLFTPAYEIEHVIPQSRYFDDSFSNKVICEAAVNKDKDNRLALEYIANEGGKIIEVGYGKTVKILDKESYEKFIKDNYARNRSKMKKLLMDDIPEAFVQRQLNDSRYISKVVKNLLSNIIREDGEQETVSKNLISTSGAITSVLKQDWGLNDIWNEIISPRFKRLNELTKSNYFGSINASTNKFLPQVPIELQKGFSKKRIDHRHHALDAIVIACATRDHVNYLNNESALGKLKKEEKLTKRYDLRSKLCIKKYNDNSKDHYKWVFEKPWDTFTQDSREKLLSTVVSFKQNLRVINKTVNYYQRWDSAKGKKITEKQTKGENWAIRKPLHKKTFLGLVKLRFKKEVTFNKALEDWENIVDKSLRNKVKELVALKYDTKLLQKFFKERDNKWEGKDIKRVEVFYSDDSNVASRVKLDDSFDKSKIETITDTGIQKILLNHLQLEKYNDQLDEKGKKITPETLAFSPDGIDELNKNIQELNGGKPHHPIYKVRIYEPKGNKFAVGQNGNKKDKYVVAADGTNLFFAIYKKEDGTRCYETYPLHLVIERQKQGLSSVEEININGDRLLFYLNPNDLVYVPNSGEQIKDSSKLDPNRIYRYIDGSGTTANFVPYSSSSLIFNTNKKEQEKLGLNLPIQNEYGVGSPQSKNQKTTDGKTMIKDVCIKLNIDRIGNIKF
jgi:CRISPR-associated endonuclease Csn1